MEGELSTIPLCCMPCVCLLCVLDVPDNHFIHLGAWCSDSFAPEGRALVPQAVDCWLHSSQRGHLMNHVLGIESS